MSDLITFSSVTPIAGLPLLVPGQAQKEFFINQALGILDVLQTRTVLASQPAPPINPEEGNCFRVTDPAEQAWAGREGHLAIWIGGAWHFVAPRDGLQVFDSVAGHWLLFRAGWRSAQTPLYPAGGAVVDAEARAALTDLIVALRDLGVLRIG